MDIVPWPKLHELRDMGDLLWNTAVDIVYTTMQILESDEAAYGAHERGNSIIELLRTYFFSTPRKEVLITQCPSESKHGGW